MSEETKTAEKPKPRRRLGPPRSRKKPDGWEDIREDDLLELPTPKEEETEEPEQDDLWRCEPWADDEVPCLLVQRDAWMDAKAKRPLASCDAIEALCAAIRPPPSVVKVPKDKVDEATRRALEDGLVLAPYAEEIDGFSSRQLLLSAATPSKHEVVRDLKSLLLGCARDPRWLAAMSGELDKLANGCDRRNNALIRLKDAKRAFTERKTIALQDDTAENQFVVTQVEGRLAQIEGLINDLADHEPAPEPEVTEDDAKSDEAPTEGDESGADADDEGDAPPPRPRPPETTATNVAPEVERAPSPPAVPPDDDANLPVAAGMARDLHAAAVAAAPPPPPKEPPSALLDAILAMILMRVPPRPGADDEAHVRWLQQKHVAFVQNWRDELGVLPRSTDAIDPRALPSAENAPPADFPAGDS
jgi:hypothetical protein